MTEMFRALFLIFIAEMGTNKILKITQDGEIKTLVEKTENETDVSNFKRPAAVFYENGFLWIADLDNHQIKKLSLN